MWHNFKNKFKNFFTEEVIEDVDNVDKELDTRPIKKPSKPLETKMTYQYPKAPFRFPVIPDNRSQEKQADEPTYKRRNRQERRVRQNSQENEVVRKINKPIQPIRKQEKEERKRPFTPTEVPSPIYGYQQRKTEKSIHNVPAFVRKQKKVSQVDITEGSPDKEDGDFKGQEETIQEIPAFVRKQPDINKSQSVDTTESSIDNQNLVQEKNDTVVDLEQKKQPIHKDEDVPETESELHKEELETRELTASTTEKAIDEEVPSQDLTEPKEASQLTREERRRKARLKQKEQKRKQIKKQKREQSEEQNSITKSIPFNVMMTPWDKRKLSSKKKPKKIEVDEEQKEEQKSNIIYSMPLHLLDDPEPSTSEDELWVQNQQQLLEKTLKHFHVEAKVVNAAQGPSITRFEVQPELGVKVSKVRNLSDDIKMNMSAKDIRIEAPIPGKNTIGIEVPNNQPQMVGLQEILENDSFKNSKSPLAVGVGLNVEGLPFITDLSKMPHGLIAGATGSGKSVCINTILISLLYKSSPDDVKLMLIDPKMVELAPYNDIPHLVSPVITDIKAATAALKWAVNEMEDRYDKFVQKGVRDIERYNEKVKQQEQTEDKMPFLVIVIDELADLMMASPQDVEDSICRIAQKARACGIHLLLATQRPSVDVITGLIKANIPSRIAFSVSSQIDSRTIIDTNGAERLLGKGDMLFIENGSGKSVRLQGAFVSDDEIERVTNYVRKLASPNYLFEQEQLLKQVAREVEEDELLDDVIQFAFDQNSISTSLLQRQFRIGYNRAARLVDTMEQKGIISGPNGSKPREVLISKRQLDDIVQVNEY